jgi:hypothetical protein
VRFTPSGGREIPAASEQIMIPRAREVAQDAVDEFAVGDDGDDREFHAAAGAEQGVHFVDATQQSAPTATAGAGGCFGPSCV